VLANACGPCFGQWDRQNVKKEKKHHCHLLQQVKKKQEIKDRDRNTKVKDIDFRQTG